VAEAQLNKSKPARKLTLGVGFLLIVVGVIVLSYPTWPIIRYKFAGPPSTSAEPVFPYPTQLLDQPVETTAPTQEKKVVLPADQRAKARVLSNQKPTDNRLVIPSIGVNIPIVEGQNQKVALNQGAWRIPNSSTPPDGGNTVLSGHRFRYRPPSNLTLYLLDQVHSGDIMIVYWQGKEYDYKVSQTKIVPRDKTDMAEPTLTPQLTVFTCHPLFSTKNRLVVIGELI
jgi:sortase A